MMKNIDGKSYDDRIKLLGLWTLKERRNRHDLFELFQILKGLSSVIIDGLFMLDENMKGTSMGHCLKLRKTRCTNQGYH